LLGICSDFMICVEAKRRPGAQGEHDARIAREVEYRVDAARVRRADLLPPSPP
jgi:hypothetical protein